MTVFLVLIYMFLIINYDIKVVYSYSIETIDWLLYFPRYTVLQFTVGLAVPLDLKDRKVNYNLAVQCNYNLPWNTTDFWKSPVFPVDSFQQKSFSDGSTNAFQTNNIKNISVDDEFKKKRVKKDLTAGEVYSAIEEFITVKGFHSDCLQKSICELSKHPLERGNEIDDHDNDVIHEILHFLLTPSVHQSFDIDKENDRRELYEKAEKIGRENGDCDLYYLKCKKSPLEYITHSIKDA